MMGDKKMLAFSHRMLSPLPIASAHEGDVLRLC